MWGKKITIHASFNFLKKICKILKVNFKSRKVWNKRSLVRVASTPRCTNWEDEGGCNPFPPPPATEITYFFSDIMIRATTLE